MRSDAGSGDVEAKRDDDADGDSDSDGTVSAAASVADCDWEGDDKEGGVKATAFGSGGKCSSSECSRASGSDAPSRPVHSTIHCEKGGKRAKPKIE